MSAFQLDASPIVNHLGDRMASVIGAYQLGRQAHRDGVVVRCGADLDRYAIRRVFTRWADAYLALPKTHT